MPSIVRPRAASRATLCLLILVAGSGCRRSAARATSSEAPLAALGQLRLPRRIAPRLSIPTTYRPCTPAASRGDAIPSSDCGGPAGSDAPPPAVLDLAARSAGRLHDTLDAGALHAAALTDLLWADSAGISLGRSISSLRIAARLTNGSPAVLGDLAAAHLLLAARTQNPRDLLEAVDVAAQALDADPRDASARFNLALALDRLGFDEQAMHAWQTYLSVDSVSPWATEAKARLRATRGARAAHAARRPSAPRASDAAVAEYAAAFPLDARRWGWDSILGAWGSAVLEGDSVRARTLLHRAEVIGTALESRGGDATLTDAVRAIQNQPRGGAARRSLAKAHRAYAMGRAAYLAADYPTARRDFEQALAMDAPSPPLREWATIFLSATLVYLNQRARAEQMLRGVVARADTMRDPVLAARARWCLGISLLRDGHDDAVRIVHSANALFARGGERENLGAVEFVEGEAAVHIGNTPAGYAELYQALMTLRPYRASVWLHNTLWTLARAAAADGLVRAAIIAQNEDVAVAERTGRPFDAVEARLSRARVSSAVGDTLAAARDVAAARAEIAHLPPGGLHQWFENDLRLSEVAELRDQPARAAAALDSVIAFFAQVDNPVRLLPAVIARAQARLAIGNVRGATADLDSAASLLDTRRADIAAAPLRASLLDAAHGIFDQLVMLQLAAGHPDTALAAAERGRISLSTVPPAHWPKDGGPAAGPPGEIVVDYALVDDTLLIWTIDGERIHLERRTVDRARLAQTIDRTRAALELRSGETQLRAELASLYDWLIRPVQSRLGRRGTPLVIVADGDIAAVPFSALYDSTRQRYLVQSHTIRFAPSLRDAAHEAATPPPRSSAVFVADPAFDRGEFAAFTSLPGAAAEVHALAASYVHPVVLAGHAADRASVEQALEHATIFHYAGHAVFDDERPDASFLLLAATDDDAGQLTATDVSRLDLRRVRLVVLSACQTMRARSGRSGGFAGLTGAFLAAGAQGVVGSLWRVDDAFTRALMIDFHRAYLTTGNGAAALRAAQLRFLHASDPLRRSPAAWAGFRYAGH